jgi:hypothetical protein
MPASELFTSVTTPKKIRKFDKKLRRTYTLSPCTRTKIKLPLRCWFSLLTLPSCGALPADFSSSGFSRLYVPIIAYCGFKGKNSIQLGGRSSLKDVSDRIEVMVWVVVAQFAGRSFRLVDEAGLPRRRSSNAFFSHHLLPHSYRCLNRMQSSTDFAITVHIHRQRQRR